MTVPSISASKSLSTEKSENVEEPDSQMLYCGNEIGKQEGGLSSSDNQTTFPAVRVIRGRIYDPDNGKTCHQCRQKTKDFAATCKNLKNNRICPIHFCHRCLLNRYGEKAEEKVLVDDWKCPKCRGICNCSICMKRHGRKPTGMLAPTAKATGFSSVSEMLLVKGLDNLDEDKIDSAEFSPRKSVSSKKELGVISPKKRGKENYFEGNSISNFHMQNPSLAPDEKKAKKLKQEGLNEVHSGNGDEKAILKSIPRRDELSAQTTGIKVMAGSENGNVTVHSVPPKMQVAKEVFCNQGECNEEDGTIKNSTTKTCKIFSDDAEVEFRKFPNAEKNMNSCSSEAHEEPNSEIQIPASCERAPVYEGVTNDEKTGCTSINVSISDCMKHDDPIVKPKAAAKRPKTRMRPVDAYNEVHSDIPVPQGTELTTISEVELLPEDVGPALQFLEFCTAFGKVLDMKEGEAESILQELLDHSRRRVLSVRLHMELLSLILKDSGEESPSLSTRNGKKSWLLALGKCVSESKVQPKELAPDCLNKGVDGYEKLNFSQKLKLLNFLCDETLGTMKLRNWIDNQNAEFVQMVKEAREKVKSMKRELQDKVAKAVIAKNDASFSAAEHEAMISSIKASAHAEMLEMRGILSKKRERPAAVRTEPILMDVNGCALWKLRCYSGEPDVLLQERATSQAIYPQERWCYYAAEQKDEIDKYINLSKQTWARLSVAPPPLREAD